MVDRAVREFMCVLPITKLLYECEITSYGISITGRVQNNPEVPPTRLTLTF